MNVSFQTRMPHHASKSHKSEHKSDRHSHMSILEEYERKRCGRDYPVNWMDPKPQSRWQSLKGLLFDLMCAFLLGATICGPALLYLYFFR